MSVALTKKTITGSELPVGPLVQYHKNDGMIYLDKIVGTELSRKLIFPFPPTSFADDGFVDVPMQTLVADSHYASVLTITVQSVSAFSQSSHAFESRVIKATCSGFNTGDITMSDVIVVYGMPVFTGTTTIGYTGVVSRTHVGESLLMVGSRLIFSAGGKERTLGAPQRRLRLYLSTEGESPSSGMIGISTFNSDEIPISEFDYSGTATVVYGMYYDNPNGTAYALLKRSGRVARWHTGRIAYAPLGGEYWSHLKSEGGGMEVDIVQLAVPSGGEIKHFANGYYLATDASDNMFLYSINNGGELITQLTGTFDPDAEISYFNVI